MFGLSFSEFFVIGIVALIVFGPEKLPKVARSIGHITGRVNRYVSDFKKDMEHELEVEELRSIKSSLSDAASSFKYQATQLKEDITSSIHEPLNKEEIPNLPDVEISQNKNNES
ncbi:Sec-independent protein translocase protein TatB [Taylorella equigenitalis]|uniref:Sec-independent protein translocase protein TatB n=1 Tax=Taylorella equigenitalis TaxID=29575 RepID=UPI000BAC7675|nr:Sec-independent protein translocase protein TatB [Taylorella equigenitalis]ASY42848.1 twin-arginine translocase subunit TatB [Taylorella equigenitalis]RBA26917.1 twin-arginine translocase subunit TatB [Taylorella equigenitalis]